MQDGLRAAKPIVRHMIRAAGNHDAPAMHDVARRDRHYIPASASRRPDAR
jgi:hypothetical protein